MNSVRKVLSKIPLVFVFPFRLLRKIEFNNFLWGLVIGAIFSLVVNLVTVKLQELEDRQRSLEAIEQEIAMNLVSANNKLGRLVQKRENGEMVDLFYTVESYSSNFWSQSSEALKYITKLDKDVQIDVSIYYSSAVNPANRMSKRAEDLLGAAIDYCYLSGEVFEVPVDRKDECLMRSDAIYVAESVAASTVSDFGFEVLEKFHPTKNRLDSPLLRLLMGTETPRILSGE